MKRMFQTLLALVLITNTYAHTPLQTVNAVIGDLSFVQSFGSLPNGMVTEQLRIQTHLRYVEELLKTKPTDHLSRQQQQKRALLFNLLHEYRNAGIFPSNFDYPNERKPCFIDRNGNICAVGYLVAKTAGKEAAMKINARHQYEYILDMNDELVTAWAHEYGLTLEECAMIQPGYAPIPIEPFIETKAPIARKYGVASGFFGGVSIAANIVNLSNRTATQSKAVAYIGLASGATQILLGVNNLKKDKTQYHLDGTTVTTSYQAQNNLSYINIATGTATIVTSALNLFLNRQLKDKRNAVNLYSSPGVYNQLNMGISFARSL